MEVLGLGAVFTLLGLIWALATPAWVERLLHARVRQILVTTGLFLIFGSVIVLSVLLPAGNVIASLIIAPGIPLGLWILWKGTASG